MVEITRTLKKKPPHTRGASASNTSPVLSVSRPEKKTNEVREPERIRLTKPYGFIEETHNKGVFQWACGEVIRNPVTIRMLIARNAPWEAC